MNHYDILRAIKTGYAPDHYTAVYAKCVGGGAKEYERYISGELPLILSDSVGKPLVNWSITGNTVQDGEPTPDNPVEVKGTGDKTGNLFDADFTAWERLQTQEYSYRWCQKIKVEIGRTYTLWSTSTSMYIFSIMDKSLRLIKSSTTTDKKLTFVATEDMVYVTTLSTSSESNIRNWLSSGNFMLNSGSEPLPYEPYGYKVTEVTRGKNLCPGFISGISISSTNGEEGRNEKYATTDYIKVDFIADDTKLCVSGLNEQFSSFIAAYNANKEYIGRTGGSKRERVYLTNNSFVNYPSGVTDKKIAYIRMTQYTFTDTEREKPKEVMLSIGEVVEYPPYEPYIEPKTSTIYLNSPLMADEVLDSTGKREKEFGKYVFTGDENVGKSVNEIVYFQIDGAKSQFEGSACTHYIFRSTSGASQGYCYWSTAFNGRIVFGDRRSIEDFKTFLKSEYEKGTPVTVYYPLAEPTSETVDVPQIPTLKGTTVIDVDTEVKAKNMTADYLSSTKSPDGVPLRTGDGEILYTADNEPLCTER